MSNNLCKIVHARQETKMYKGSRFQIICNLLPLRWILLQARANTQLPFIFNNKLHVSGKLLALFVWITHIGGIKST